MEKKTDLDKFIELYKGFGIDVKPYKEEGHTTITLGADSSSENTTTHPKLVGYSGFVSDICFDKNGKFMEQGFFE